MNLITEIIIERDGSYFPVRVIRGQRTRAWFEHPTTGEEREEILTESEQDEAREKFAREESLDESLDDFPGHFANRRESEQLAEEYFARIGERRDRRNA